MKKVYAVVGRKRVGKDTVADYICEKLSCKKHALAQPLKDLVCNMFGITLEQLDKYKNEGFNLEAYYPEVYDPDTMLHSPVDVSFRAILQRCGDSQKRFFGLDCYMRKLHEKLIHEDVIVVPDVRLKEEQEWLMNNTNVTFIKIVRNVNTDRDSAHRTEQEVDKLGYDVLVDNNSSFEDLYKQIDNIIK